MNEKRKKAIDVFIILLEQEHKMKTQNKHTKMNKLNIFFWRKNKVFQETDLHTVNPQSYFWISQFFGASSVKKMEN